MINKESLSLLLYAIDFFEKNNCIFVELPWTVNEEFSNITKPIEKENFYIKNKVLVGSGEQSFLELALSNKYNFEKDKIYFGITPCFRDDIEDNIHHKYFLKLELFSVSENKKILFDIINTCMLFLDNICDERVVLKQTSDVSYDINTLNSDIELGSYSMNTYNIYNEFSWICGTGVAIPRIYKK